MPSRSRTTFLRAWAAWDSSGLYGRRGEEIFENLNHDLSGKGKTGPDCAINSSFFSGRLLLLGFDGRRRERSALELMGVEWSGMEYSVDFSDKYHIFQVG